MAISNKRIPNPTAGILILVATGTFLFFGFDVPDMFRMAAFPLEYWTEKRNKAQDLVIFYAKEVKECQILLATRPHARSQELRQLLAEGFTVQEASDLFALYDEADNQVCLVMREGLAEQQVRLKMATDHLAGYPSVR
jgi:hypothetical protein